MIKEPQNPFVGMRVFSLKLLLDQLISVNLANEQGPSLEVDQSLYLLLMIVDSEKDFCWDIVDGESFYEVPRRWQTLLAYLFGIQQNRVNVPLEVPKILVQENPRGVNRTLVDDSSFHCLETVLDATASIYYLDLPLLS